jgi:hypothetical protein
VSGSTFLSNAVGIELEWSGATYTPTVEDNRFEGNGWPVTIHYNSAGSYANIHDNSAFNNGQNGIRVGGVIDRDTAWTPNDGMPYVIHYDSLWGPPYGEQLAVSVGTTLTVQPGTVVKFEYAGQWSSTSLYLSGHLVAEGTASAPIIFTSDRDDSYGGDTNNDGSTSSPAPADWGGIRVLGSLANASLDHVTLSYGGYFYCSDRCTGSQANLYVEYGSLSLANSNVGFSAGASVRILNSSPFIYANLIHNSVMGIYSENSYPTVIYNRIYGNTLYGMFNNSDSIIDANSNWWGDDLGPYPFNLLNLGNSVNFQSHYDETLKCRIVDKLYVEPRPWLFANGKLAPWVPIPCIPDVGLGE